MLLPAAVTHDGGISTSHGESLALIIQYWNRVWRRQTSCPELNRLQSEGSSATPRCFDQNPSFDAHELLSQARRGTHGSAGPDGWSSEEVSHLPPYYWVLMAGMLNKWMRQGRFPTVWRHCRMIMIPKDEFDVLSGPVPVSKLRPIAVFPVHYRLLSSCMAKRASTQQWLQHRTPPWMHGALRGRSAPDALARLEDAFHADPHAILVSLDQKQCFDHVHPALGVAKLQEAGWPPQWASLLRFVWQEQHRWVQIGGHCASHAEVVSTSVPQGCACAPLTLVVLLTEAAREIQSVSEQLPFTQTIFLDDRNAVVDSPGSALAYIRRWERATANLGLLESSDKLRIVCRRAEDEAALLSLGVPAQSVVPTTKVLGVDFSRISGTGPVAAGRDAAAARMVARLATMPFPPAFREDLFRTRIVPLLAWRAWWEPVDKQTLGEKWTTKLRKAFGVARAASRHLWKLLTGVHVEMGPATDIAGLRHFARAYAYWTGSGVELRRGRWRARAAMLMRRAGFREQRPGLWRDSQGVLCRWEHPHVKHDLDRVAHKLRELSRKEQFQAFLLHPRREQAEAISAGVGYDEGICKVARALFSRASKEQRGVMLGASYSVAAFDKLRRNAGKHDQVLVRKCPYCDAPVVPDWQHLSWECPSFARDRPEVPAYVLSRRFGWPGPGEGMTTAAPRLAFLAGVRARVRLGFGVRASRDGGEPRGAV